ncbi:hypothetical protein FKM82_014303 [Ascaphus truei]
MESNQKSGDGLAGTQKEAALRALVQRTGYSLTQENGQRRYGGPPPDWDAPTPERGCEIFIGKLPRDLFEDELIPLCEKIGQIYEVRMMMDFNGNNRGYAFVTFTNRQDARNAIKQLNNYEIRNGRLLGVCASVDNCRLFVGGIPKTKKREEILVELRKVTEGRIQLWGHPIAVDWAEPEVEVDEDTMSSVKILYVRNLMLTTTEETIEKEFNNIKPGAVERVKKIRDYAFVHFNNRCDAIDSMNALNGKIIDGSPIEVTLAKPVDKDSYVRYTRGTGGRGGTIQGEYAYTIGHVYDPATAYLGAPVFYAPPTYAAAIPNITFPSAKGYVSNRGLVRPPSIRGAAGVRGLGGRGYLAYTGLGRGYSGYQMKGDKRADEKLYDILPGMELTPMSALKPQGIKLAPQILEEICQKSNWGQPVYQLHSAIGQDQRQLFLYKITIPVLASQNPAIHPFTPPKLCVSVDEAKIFAAEYTLQTLGIPTETTELPAAFAGYTIANSAATIAATQLKQAVAMGQDLAAYATYEAYPAFAVATRGDGYGAF